MKIDKSYETGVLWQDIQHGQLIQLFDAFHTKNPKTSDPQAFVHATASLVMYINHHLYLEETYMEKYDYPEKEFHIQEHRKLVQMVKSFRKKYPSFSDEGLKELEETIKDWIINHILHNDKKLGEFILNREEELWLNRP